MFKNTRIKYIKIVNGLFGEQLIIRYKNEPESLLTDKRVDLKDFKKKQSLFYKEAVKKSGKAN